MISRGANSLLWMSITGLTFAHGLLCQRPLDPFAEKQKGAQMTRSETGPRPPDQDAIFVIQVLRTSQLALGYTGTAFGDNTSEQFKVEAERLNQSYASLRDQLTDIGDRLGVTARAALSSSDRHQIGNMARLRSSPDYEKRFADDMEALTRSTLKECAREQAKGHDPAVRTVAHACIDMLQPQASRAGK